MHACLQADVAQVYLSVPQGGGFMMGPLDKAIKGPRANKKRVDRPTDVSVVCFPQILRGVAHPLLVIYLLI